MKKNKKTHLKLNRSKGHRKYYGTVSGGVLHACEEMVKLRATPLQHVRRPVFDYDFEHSYAKKCRPSVTPSKVRQYVANTPLERKKRHLTPQKNSAKKNQTPADRAG